MLHETIIEEKLQTTVAGEYDVAVCGGGFAGISAALASARMGRKTILLEKQYVLGGLGTSGIVTIYLPLCDGLGNQVSFGIAEELLRLSIHHGAEARYPENWLDKIGTRTEKDKRFEVQYNPQLFAILSEKLLRDSGVDILYGTYAVGVNLNTDKIEHIITENKSGRLSYKVKSVVDATGDCDIAKFANAPTQIFKQGNILAGWYYSVGKNGYKLNMVGFADIPDEEKLSDDISSEIYLRTDDGDKTTVRRFSGLNGEELSEQTCLSHRFTYEDFLKKRQNDPSILPVTLATIPQIRMTRRIIGEYELAHTEMHKYFEDSIGMIPNWKQRGPIYEIPFRTLYNAKLKNLICAGRCVSVTETMWDIMRVIPCCAVTGQAAGTAAAMSDNFPNLDVKALQKQLMKDGVVLHENMSKEMGVCFGD